MKFEKFLRTPTLKNICERLLLKQNRNSQFDLEDCSFQKSQNEIFTGFPKTRKLVAQIPSPPFPVIFDTVDIFLDYTYAGFN